MPWPGDTQVVDILTYHMWNLNYHEGQLVYIQMALGVGTPFDGIQLCHIGDCLTGSTSLSRMPALGLNSFDRTRFMGKTSLCSGAEILPRRSCPQVLTTDQ